MSIEIKQHYQVTGYHRSPIGDFVVVQLAPNGTGGADSLRVATEHEDALRQGDYVLVTIELVHRAPDDECAEPPPRRTA